MYPDGSDHEVSTTTRFLSNCTAPSSLLPSVRELVGSNTHRANGEFVIQEGTQHLQSTAVSPAATHSRGIKIHLSLALRSLASNHSTTTFHPAFYALLFNYCTQHTVQYTRLTTVKITTPQIHHRTTHSSRSSHFVHQCRPAPRLSVLVGSLSSSSSDAAPSCSSEPVSRCIIVPATATRIMLSNLPGICGLIQRNRRSIWSGSARTI